MSADFRNDLPGMGDIVTRSLSPERELNPPVIVLTNSQTEHHVPDAEATRIACALDTFRLRAVW